MRTRYYSATLVIGMWLASSQVTGTDTSNLPGNRWTYRIMKIGKHASEILLRDLHFVVVEPGGAVLLLPWTLNIQTPKLLGLSEKNLNSFTFTRARPLLNSTKAFYWHCPQLILA